MKSRLPKDAKITLWFPTRCKMITSRDLEEIKSLRSNIGESVQIEVASTFFTQGPTGLIQHKIILTFFLVNRVH